MKKNNNCVLFSMHLCGSILHSPTKYLIPIGPLWSKNLNKIFELLKVISYPHQGCIYLIKNTLNAAIL